LLCYQLKLVKEPDELLQAIFDYGQEVGLLTQKAFPSGIPISLPHQKASSIQYQ
jgi:hypothetical protein